MGGPCDRGGAYRVLVATSEGKTPREKPRHMWEDKIKMDFIIRKVEGASEFGNKALGCIKCE